MDEFVAEAKRLRACADDAERQFMEYLLAAEEEPSIWEGSGLTFLELIERAGICEATRYSAWKRGQRNLAEAGVDAASVDVKATIALASVRKVEDVRTAVERFAEWTEANGTSISSSSARRIVREVKIGGAAARTRHRSVASMEEEIEKLRADNEELREAVKQLKAENRKLKRAAKKPGKRAP